MRWAVAISVVIAATAHSAEPDYDIRVPVAAPEWRSGFTLDVSIGALVSRIDQYKPVPAYNVGLRVGWDFRVSQRIGLGAELGLDVVPFTPDGYFLPARYTRVKGLGGGRLTVHFAHGYFFLRLLVGVDNISGTLKESGGIGIGMPWTKTVGVNTNGVGVVPEIGVSMRLYKALHAGATIGFPWAYYPADYGGVSTVDFTFTGTLSVHL
jgi:hypothetical protein